MNGLLRRLYGAYARMGRRAARNITDHRAFAISLKLGISA